MTLIELLFVIAILLIQMTIALPNFLEPQIRTTAPRTRTTPAYGLIARKVEGTFPVEVSSGVPLSSLNR